MADFIFVWRVKTETFANMLCTLYSLLLFNIVFATGRFGPYKCYLVRVAPCAKQTQPVLKDPPLLYSAEVYNTSTKHFLMRGNFTVLKDVRCKKLNMKAYYWEFGRWNPQYTMNIVGCKSVFLPMALKVTRVKVELKTCTFLKGSFIYQNLDTNELEHTWMTTQEYGRILWTAELFTPAGSAFCWEFETNIIPA